MLKVARNTAITPLIADKSKDILAEANTARQSNNLMAMRKANDNLQAMYREWGYSPFVNFFGILQIPFFFAMFRTCWRCSGAPVPGWETGGTFWFNDLTAADPYFILPAISGITTAATILVLFFR
jgi:YidC/Oxa1 family membrane protein insertase